MSILVTTDFSENSAVALRTAARLARARDVPLTVLYCVEAAADEHRWYPEDPIETPEAYGRGAMERLESFLDEHLPEEKRPDVLEAELELDHAADGIATFLERGDFDLVAMGATGRNRVTNFLLGSTPEEVARRSEVPVLVVPPDADDTSPWKRILAPVDFSECSRTSLDYAIEMAREHDAELHVMHAFFAPAGVEASSIPAMAPPEAREALEEEHAKRFQHLLDETDLQGVDWERHDVFDLPHRAIVETVDSVGADLLVMGTHGRRGMGKLLLGSTANKVLRQMPCSIVTLRRPLSEE